MTLEQLKKELAAMLDPLDIPRSWTQRQLNAYEERRALLARRISTIEDCETTLAELNPQVIPLTEWRDHLAEWRKTCCDELENIEPHSRDLSTMDLQQGLGLSIRNIDSGCTYWPNGAPGLGTRLSELIHAAGYEPRPGSPGVAWLGSMVEVEQRIADLQKRLAAAQAQLDDALLDDADREAKAKEEKARQDALSALPQRKTRGDGTQYDKYPDGRRVEVTVEQ